MIESWVTPTFYVLKNGTVVAKAEGSPKKERRSELLAAAWQARLVQWPWGEPVDSRGFLDVRTDGPGFQVRLRSQMPKSTLASVNPA